MIRQATSEDLGTLKAMLYELYAASKYVGRAEVSDKAARDLIAGAIAMQGQHGPQASRVLLYEKDGEAIGFMIGVLDRIYHIGSKLTANDLFLYVRPGNGVRPVLALIDGYVAWARSKRAVAEIVISWSDAIEGSEEIADLYTRKGFTKSGEQFEMRLDAEMRAAA